MVLHDYWKVLYPQSLPEWRNCVSNKSPKPNLHKLLYVDSNKHNFSRYANATCIKPMLSVWTIMKLRLVLQNVLWGEIVMSHDLDCWTTVT